MLDATPLPASDRRADSAPRLRALDDLEAELAALAEHVARVDRLIDGKTTVLSAADGGADHA